MKTTRHLLIGIFLISMGALALEVVLTRIFSVTMWYHFAFLAISMALMGSATAGVFIYFFPQLSKPGTAQMWIGRASVALAVTVPAVFLIYLRIPFRPVLMNRDGAFSFEQIGWLALIYVLLSLPFFLSGSVLALTLAVGIVVGLGALGDLTVQGAVDDLEFEHPLLDQFIELALHLAGAVPFRRRLLLQTGYLRLLPADGSPDGEKDHRKQDNQQAEFDSDAGPILLYPS